MVTASWYALITQIDADGVACMSIAIVGRAMLAIAPSITAIETARPMVRTAQ